MEIYKDIEIVDLGLKYKDNLIISDLHIGLEEAMNKEGVLIPRFQFKEILNKLNKILSEHKYKRVIILGDLKHEFGSISDQEWRDVLHLLDFLSDKEVILVKGNHDTIIGPIAEKRNVKVVNSYQIDEITFLHGDKIIPNLSKVLVIGHEHPAISFNERPDEKFKCFLKGKWKGNILIVLPSFNFVTEGHDILKEEILSPFLKQNLDDFEVFLVEDTILYFGKIAKIKKI